MDSRHAGLGDPLARRILMAAWAITAAILLVLGLIGCAAEEPASGWNGTVDTLASGHVIVRNSDIPIWGPGEAWSVREELRIGTLDGTGPDMFGDVIDFEVDAYGRFWVFEGQARELRVFEGDGRFVRTVGRQGEGPGEFNRVIGMDWGPDGHLWLADPANNRLSVVDTTGAFVASHPTIGGVVVRPWPGGFDDSGHFYTYGIDTASEDEMIALVMVRYGRDLQPIDSVAPPAFPGREELFELRSENHWMIAGVPFSPNLEWRLGRDATYWAGLTGEYRIYQLAWGGDTLRTILRDYDPLPVTAEDRNRAREDLQWFVDAGGRPDWSRVPSVKPAFEEFVLDDEDRLWVQLVADGDEAGRRFDVFDAEGRFLGGLLTPFSVRFYPVPIIRDGYIYSVTEDELEVPFVVRGRIEIPEAS